ncbi:uncharacterized protein [Physcomitrium patens]|uniref:uncharacterized protein isoform X3 n=1 Tax=Physcomitrium patens TaxID=3218 RepID=UPI003CCD5502
MMSSLPLHVGRNFMVMTRSTCRSLHHDFKLFGWGVFRPLIHVVWFPLPLHIATSARISDGSCLFEEFVAGWMLCGGRRCKAAF